MVLTCDTALGKTLKRHYSVIDWSVVDNEFALRAKSNYESNAELDGYIAFAYDEDTVVSMFMSTVNSAIVGPDNSIISAYDAWVKSEDLPVTFGRSVDGPKSAYCCIINFYSQAAANNAAEVFSGAYSYKGLHGRANPGQRCIYLITSSVDDYGVMRAMIDAVGYEQLAQFFGVARMQVYWREVEGLPPVIRVPKVELSLDLVRNIPDTFTEDVADESKVAIIDIADSDPVGRKVLGTYVCLEAQQMLKVEFPSWYKELMLQIEECSRDNKVNSYPTVAERNLAIFSDLRKDGYMVRGSWLRGFSPGVEFWK